MSKGLISLFSLFIPLCLWAQTPKDMLVAPASSLERDTTGQRDLIGIFLDVTKIQIHHPRAETGRRVYWTVLPLSTSVPGGGNALITSTTAGFYLGDRKDTYLSTATFSPSFNFRGQFNFPIRANIWSPSSHESDWRFTDPVSSAIKTNNRPRAIA